MGYGF
jgi:chaperonin GroES